MEASDRAVRVEEFTWKVIEALAMESLRQHKREDVPGFLGPRVASVVQQAGGTEDQARSVMDEILGLGPLEPLLRDKSIQVIEIAGPKGVTITRDGASQASDYVFADDKHLRRVFERILKSVGKTLGEPVDATMMDGSVLTVNMKDGDVHATITRPSA